MEAQDTARQAGQQQIDALHLLFALISQEGSVVLTLLQKIGVDIENLKKRAKSALEKIPVIATPQTLGQFYLTQDMAKVLDRARQESMKMGDEFMPLGQGHLAQTGDGTARNLRHQGEPDVLVIVIRQA